MSAESFEVLHQPWVIRKVFKQSATADVFLKLVFMKNLKKFPAERLPMVSCWAGYKSRLPDSDEELRQTL